MRRRRLRDRDGRDNFLRMAYHGWYHVMGNTRGTWPPGDERGWRSYKHREHCDGDYKNPPPPDPRNAKKLQRATALMKHPPVHLNVAERAIVCIAMAEKMRTLGAEVIDLCMNDVHFHGLVRFDGVGEWISVDEAESRGIAIPRLYGAAREVVRVENGVTLVRVVPGMTAANMLEDGRDPLPRHVVGVAKKHASFSLREAGHGRDGGAFATRCKVKPIEDLDHKIRVEKYIVDHHEQGAAVLSMIAVELTAAELRDWRGA